MASRFPSAAGNRAFIPAAPPFPETTSQKDTRIMQNSHRFMPLFGLAAFAALALAPRPATAQTTVISFAPGSTGFEIAATNYGVTSYNLGYSFSVNTPIVVTQLGYFADPSYYDPGYTDPNNPANDAPANPYYDVSNSTSQPYAASHDVGIYTSDGNLLLSGTVTQSDPLANNFRYTTPNAGPGLVLTPGVSYIIAGVTGTYDPFLEDVQIDNADGSAQDGITTAHEFNYGGSVSAVGNSLTDNNFQSSSESDPGLFGPNFRFTNDLPASAAPEPGQWAALGLVAAGLSIQVLRVRRRANAAQ